MFKTILVATDGSAHAQKAVDVAADIAKIYGARLVLAHVLMRGAAPADLYALADTVGLPDGAREKLDALSEIPLAASAMSGGYAAVPIPYELLEDVGQNILTRAREAAVSEGVLSVETCMLDGDMANGLLQRAAEENADLIVLGSRGMGEIKGLLLGSVSHKVSQLAPCPCMTVKARDAN